MSAVQINFAGEEELRELPGVGARVAKNILRFREENFPITTANIHDIHKLRTSKRLLQLIDFTDQPVHAKGRSRPTYQPQEYFVQGLSQFMNANQPNRDFSENLQHMSWPVTPVQAQAQSPPQVVGFSSPHQVGYQPAAQYQPATKYQPGYSENQPQSSLPATPVQAQVHHPPQLVGYPSQYQPTSRYQSTSQYQPMSRYQPMSQYQPMSPYQRKSQFRPIRQ